MRYLPSTWWCSPSAWWSCWCVTTAAWCIATAAWCITTAAWFTDDFDHFVWSWCWSKITVSEIVGWFLDQFNDFGWSLWWWWWRWGWETWWTSACSLNDNFNNFWALGWCTIWWGWGSIAWCWGSVAWCWCWVSATEWSWFLDYLLIEQIPSDYFFYSFSFYESIYMIEK